MHLLLLFLEKTGFIYFQKLMFVFTNIIKLCS
jgi:hypothetical protein